MSSNHSPTRILESTNIVSVLYMNVEDKDKYNRMLIKLEPLMSGERNDKLMDESMAVFKSPEVKG